MSDERYFMLSEARRTYHFPHGERKVFDDTYKLRVSNSGYHYLDYEDGKKTAILPPTWLCIEIAGGTTN